MNIKLLRKQAIFHLPNYSLHGDLAAYSYLMAGDADTETVVGYLQKAIDADPQNAAVQQLNQAIRKLQKDAQLKK